MKRRENGPRTASKRRGLHFPALPVTGVLWRVVAVLTAVAALVCLAACSVWARGCWENHAALAGVQETQYAAPLVRDYRLTDGGFSYEVDTAMGETKTVMTIYPGIRSDGGRYGKGFYVEKNGGWVKPVTVGDAWRSCGSALVLGTIATAVLGLGILATKRELLPENYRVPDKRWIRGVWWLSAIAVFVAVVVVAAPLVA